MPPKTNQPLGARRVALTAAVALGISSLLQATTATGAEPGFQSLFNGKDLSGWDGNSKLWSVKEGAITGETTAEHPIDGNTFLIWTNGLVSDFELRCSFKIAAHNDKNFANSGIQYRSKILDPANWVVGGYQADMEAGSTYTGILYEERMTRGIMAARGEKVVWGEDCQKKVTGSLGKSEEIQAGIKPGEWNEYVVIANGNHLQHFINGKPTVDVTDDCVAKRATNGVLALQIHKGLPMFVQFKDLRLKPLSGSQASASDELAPLQGTWQVAAVEANGADVPAEDVTNIIVSIKGNKYEIQNLDTPGGGNFTLNTAKNPKEMDVHVTSGPDQGQSWPAIYDLNGDRLRVCYARQGTKRPTSFSSSDDASFTLITYQRKKQ